MRDIIVIGISLLIVICGVAGLRHYMVTPDRAAAAAREASRLQRKQAQRAATLKVQENLRRDEEAFQQSRAEIRRHSGAYAGAAHPKPPLAAGEYPVDRFSELLDWNQQWVIEHMRLPPSERHESMMRMSQDPRMKYLIRESERTD